MTAGQAAAAAVLGGCGCWVLAGLVSVRWYLLALLRCSLRVVSALPLLGLLGSVLAASVRLSLRLARAVAAIPSSSDRTTTGSSRRSSWSPTAGLPIVGRLLARLATYPPLRCRRCLPSRPRCGAAAWPGRVARCR